MKTILFAGAALAALCVPAMADYQLVIFSSRAYLTASGNGVASGNVKVIPGFSSSTTCATAASAAASFDNASPGGGGKLNVNAFCVNVN